MAEIMSDSFYIDFVKGQFDIAEKNKEKQVTFTNRGPFKASVVLSKLISTATQSIDIYTAYLSAPFYKIEDFRVALNKYPALKIRIICQYDYRTNPTAQSIVSDLDGFVLDENLEVEVRILSEDNDVKITIAQSGLNHFVNVDDNKLRIEDSHEERTATILLNDSDLAANYKVIFNNLWDGYCQSNS